MPVVFSFWAVSAMPIKLRLAHSCRCEWSAMLHFMSSMGGHLDDAYSEGCVAFAFCLVCWCVGAPCVPFAELVAVVRALGGVKIAHPRCTCLWSGYGAYRVVEAAASIVMSA